MPSTTLLSTALFDKYIKEYALGMDVCIDSLPFTSIESAINEATKNDIKILTLHPVNVVFTSVNAIKALNEYLEIKTTGWHIYCLDHATKDAVIQCFGNEAIRGAAPNAKELSELILQQNDIKTVYFFCGDIHLDTLPVALKQGCIDVKEMVVYSTTATPHSITKSYDGILFYSPSAVSSFFSINQIPARTVLFAIGETTAAAIREFSTNHIIISSAPSKQTMITEAVSYFAALKR